MGAFFVTTNRTRVEVALQTLRDQGLADATTRRCGQYTIVCARRADEPESWIEPIEGGFIAAAGTFVFRKLVGSAALTAFYKAYAGDRSLLDECYGSFALLLIKGGLHAFSDGAGLHPIFHDADGASSAFMPLALSSSQLTMNEDAAVEYVLNGAIYGDETIVNEITSLRRGQYIADGLQVAGSPVRPAKVPVLPLSQLLAQADAALAGYLEHILPIFSSVLLPLTGGYDSRLLFAQLDRLGAKPRLYVTRQPGEDVSSAAAVAKAGGLELEIREPDRAMVEIGDLSAFLERNALAADGLFFKGLFLVDLATTHAAVPCGGVLLSGAGGEIYRDYYQLPPGEITAHQVARAFFMKFDARSFPDLDRRRYLDRMAAKVAQLAGERLDWQAVNWLYPNLRGRGWFGHEIAMKNMRNCVLAPYFDHHVADATMGLPRAAKRAGSFEARLIRCASPRIAAAPSQYGHDFTRTPLRRHLQDAAKSIMPTSLRPLLYSMKGRKRALPPGGLMAAEHVANVFPSGLKYMGRYFRLDQPMIPLERSRLLSAEYLLRRLNA